MYHYLDHNSTTPLDERVLAAMLPYLQGQFGNASSLHALGRAARNAVDHAREQVAALVKAHPSQVIFTSGGTEANNLALKGVAAHQPLGRLAISAIEHASLRGPADALAQQGWAVDNIAVDNDGRVSAIPTLHPATRLVSVMWANNETGVIQDIPAIAAITRAHGAVMHTDAIQAAGKLALDFPASGVHLMSLSAHKIYGPKGVGALVVDKALELAPLLHGGGQEQDRRAGTENVAAIVGFGKAAELAREELATRAAHARLLRDALESRLNALPGVTIMAKQAERLPNTVMCTVSGIDGESLVMNLDRQQIAASAGSACASRSGEPSHVLLAMGVDSDLARCALRISLGRGNILADVDALIAELRNQLHALQRMETRAWA